MKHYDKRKVLNKYWDGSTVTNPFGRKIVADEFHALNAVIQSTTSDTFLRRAIAVNKLLENKKSFTMGLIHDSMVIDFDRNDKDILENLIKVGTWGCSRRKIRRIFSQARVHCYLSHKKSYAKM